MAVWQEPKSWLGRESFMRDCSTCQGTGEGITGKACSACAGKGYITEKVDNHDDELPGWPSGKALRIYAEKDGGSIPSLGSFYD